MDQALSCCRKRRLRWCPAWRRAEMKIKTISKSRKCIHNHVHVGKSSIVITVFPLHDFRHNFYKFNAPIRNIDTTETDVVVYSAAAGACSKCTHKERYEAAALVLFDRLPQTVAAQTQLVVARQQPHLHETDQTRLLHRRVRLQQQQPAMTSSLIRHCAMAQN